MFSVGSDILKIERIAKIIEKSPRFVEKYYGRDEIEYLKSINYRAQTVAGMFCAKEAFSKALGTGVSGFNLNEVSLLHKENGKPYLEFSGKASEIVNGSRLSFDVSITHTDSIATAIVIAFRGEAL